MNIFNYRWAVLCLAIFAFGANSVLAQQARIIPRAPDIAATSYVLMDATTGDILVESNADIPLPPASLTKIMTDYVVASELENGNISLDDEVYISVKAWQMEGSKMFIQEGTTVRLEDLIYGMVVQSGNDASVALAEHVAGSEDAFADMMNQHAEMLGMENSYFINAHGMPEDQHVMSARDLSTLAQALIERFPENYEIYSVPEFTYNGIRQPNRNRLLFQDRNVDGMKTGFTDAAGYCLVASATRDGMRLIAVVMGTDSVNARTIEAQKLLTYGFRFYETHELFTGNEVLSSAEVWSGKSNTIDIGVQEQVFITIPNNSSDELLTELQIDESLRAPINAGDILGQVTISFDDQVYYQGEVIALQTIERGSLIKRIMDWLTLFFMSLFG
ncbi:MAG: serine-type D-Ala-D-Ala carboxypeptidase [SAR86 cluster bacterium]|uniref:serine-type D-Ala-D-Ala carboxypeptidase n=1 Tax=SAR86 cluster bacterium TaxID=2030880 RepID=A0A2A5CBK9_9GAMM|nr:MAG: serine-type D-Ala-D-Ala carboxypeptidase [SAR86 cluster bacterium]